MRVGGIAYRTIGVADDGRSVEFIDQTKLPHRFERLRITTLDEAVHAICTMQVRGAPLIGAMAAYGVCLALVRDASDAALEHSVVTLRATRPTAVNLQWALERCRAHLAPLATNKRVEAAYALAQTICDEDVEACAAIGRHGVALIEAAWQRAEQKRAVNLLTHCNAGWLATVDWGTALAPIYLAHERGIPVHVWVDETRPRNQGAALTAWELLQHGVPHTVIADNLGGHLMQRGQVDLCLVGSDRTTQKGDVCNKIGTYLKALAAHDNRVPFYVALPHSTIDWTLEDGVREIPIEERSGEEVSHVLGQNERGRACAVRIVPEGSPVANYAFDVTPARLITGLITERGICAASRAGLQSLYPEKS